jgi:hypothetical protein
MSHLCPVLQKWDSLEDGWVLVHASIYNLLWCHVANVTVHLWERERTDGVSMLYWTVCAHISDHSDIAFWNQPQVLTKTAIDLLATGVPLFPNSS